MLSEQSLYYRFFRRQQKKPNARAGFSFPLTLPERDGDGYLTDMGEWTEEIAREMARVDEFELTEEKWNQIIKAREYYEEFGSVPPIRKFAKYIEQDQTVVFKLWMTGPMKPITKYGGLPKPTGCV